MLVNVKDYYDRHAKSYDYELEQPYWKLSDEITWHNIQKFLPKKKNALILDAGGGTGRWAIKLAKLGYNVILTDISEGMLEVAKQNIEKLKLSEKIKLKKVDIRNMKCFRSNFFDMAIAEGDVVSYCLNAEKAIKELSRVVKKNGIVIVSVDNKYAFIRGYASIGDMKNVRDVIKTSKTLFPPFEREQFKTLLFTPEKIKNLFKKNKLKPIRIIGKPVLLGGLSLKEKNKLLSNKKIFNDILELELKYCDKKFLIGCGDHIEIVGKKE